MTDLTPTEINRRVAEACGLPVIMHDGKCLYHEDDRLKLAGKPFESKGCVLATETFDPYHDANDALWAATRVELWDDRILFLPRHPDNLWAICQFDAGDCITHGSGTTLPAAICNAILALKEKE